MLAGGEPSILSMLVVSVLRLLWFTQVGDGNRVKIASTMDYERSWDHRGSSNSFSCNSVGLGPPPSALGKYPDQL